MEDCAVVANSSTRVNLPNSKVPPKMIAKGRIAPTPSADLGTSLTEFHNYMARKCFPNDESDVNLEEPTEGGAVTSNESSAKKKASKKKSGEGSDPHSCDRAISTYWRMVKDKFENQCAEYIVAKTLSSNLLTGGRDAPRKSEENSFTEKKGVNVDHPISGKDSAPTGNSKTSGGGQ
jgi:hypothetical protein